MVLCFEWFSKQAANILLNSINHVACIIEIQPDLFEAGTEFLNLSLQRRCTPGWASASFKSFLHPSRFRATIFQFLHPSLLQRLLFRFSPGRRPSISPVFVTRNFSEVRESVQRSTPNLEDQGTSLSLTPYPSTSPPRVTLPVATLPAA